MGPGTTWEFGKTGKTEQLVQKPICLPHNAIEGVLTRQKCAEKLCATLWARVSDFLSHRIFKSSINFHDFFVNCKFNVLEMALETRHFVQVLSRTPLLFIPRYLTNIIFENNFQKKIENWKSENLKFRKPRFTNKCPELINHELIIKSIK